MRLIELVPRTADCGRHLRQCLRQRHLLDQELRIRRVGLVIQRQATYRPGLDETLLVGRAAHRQHRDRLDGVQEDLTRAAEGGQRG
jgi:hypothetical protein